MTAPATYGPASRIGFIGLGAMGGGMARCLLRNGYKVDVYARRPEAAQALQQAGAKAAATPAAMAGCELVFLCLPDAPAVEDVLFGAGGLAAALRPGSCVVDTSTIASTSARAIGARLAALGVSFLDAPVTGGQQGAEAGTLGTMVGGPLEILDACRDAMGAFCKTITHVGALGAGQTVKACNQVAVNGALLGVADAMALARKEGVDLKLMRDVLLGGAAKSFSLENHGARIISGNFKPGFRARLMRKDVRLALDTARASGLVLPTATLAEGLLDAWCEAGHADWDWSSVALLVQQRSGLDVPGGQEPS